MEMDSVIGQLSSGKSQKQTFQTKSHTKNFLNSGGLAQLMVTQYHSFQMTAEMD